MLILQAWLVCQALAFDPRQPASSYLRTDFTVEDGLPDNQVNAITQPRNGFLWVGTGRGLYRFDRGHFVTVIPDDWISTMDQTAIGHLLIVTGHGFLEWDGARILRYPEFPKRLGSYVHRYIAAQKAQEPEIQASLA